jgi:tetratricopeptide (TPR) repeat protein
MIVKNESKIIRRLLESVLPYIDYYCICDTGSTDDTCEIIQQFFQEHGIQGNLIYETFRDFGHNRTFALKACNKLQQQADYILLLDADMIFECKMAPEEFRAHLTKDAYYIYQGSSRFFYKNTRIVRNRAGFTYWGVTHEYVNAPQGTIYECFDKDQVFINDIGDGGSKGNKGQRDIELLTKGLQDNPNNDRYTFYLANSYADTGENEKAIEYYQKRIAIGGWIEEIWYSHFNMANCYERMGNMSQAIYHWLEAFNKFPERIENLYEIIRYYRTQGNNQLAYHVYTLADQVRKNTTKKDFLFYRKHISDYQLDYELSVIGYYCNPDKLPLNQVCMKVLSAHGLEDQYYKNTLSNYKFYTDHIQSVGIPTVFNKLVFDDETKTLVSSTPSICRGSIDDETIICTRFVDYRIDDNGNYINHDNITTKNVITTHNDGVKYQEFVLDYDKTKDGRYVGLEDVRLFPFQNKLYYICNRGVDLGDNQTRMQVEFGEIVGETCVCPVLLHKDGQTSTEKNWVLFGTDNIINCVYKWGPLTIGTINQDTGAFQETHIQTDVPRFFQDVRGSTNGVMVGDDEIWFICHLVSYEDRRYYYHLMVVLDATTYKLKKYTPLWKFDKENKVEYTLGFIYDDSSTSLTIGYSVYDRETKYVNVAKKWFDTTFIRV